MKNTLQRSITSKRLEFKPIITAANMTLGVHQYMATTDQAQLIEVAVKNYGYLIKTVALRNWTFKEFADIIEKKFDMANPKNAQIVSTLRAVHTVTEKSEKVAAAVETLSREQCVDILDHYIGVACYDDVDEEEMRTKVFVAFCRGKVPAEAIEDHEYNVTH